MSGPAAFEFFKNEYNEQDVLIRTEAIAKLPIIAALMGPEKVRSDLLPFLVGMLFLYLNIHLYFFLQLFYV